MPNPLMLEGQVDTQDPRDIKIKSLEDELRRLARREANLRDELESANRKAERAVGELRRQLSPLYQALRMVFGEIDAIAPESSAAMAPAGAPTTTKNQAVWEAWKQKMPETARKCIDALLTYGELNTQQLAIATGLHRTTIPKGIFDLNKAGLINKNGGRFSLKEL